MALSADFRLENLDALQAGAWWLYLLAGVVQFGLHGHQIIKYLGGKAGIGDASIRTEIIQCGWRLPALLFAAIVVPSLPLLSAVILDTLGRVGRILAMDGARRWYEKQQHSDVTSWMGVHTNPLGESW